MSIYLSATIVIGIFVLYAVIGVTVGRRALRGRVREGHNDVLVPIFLTAGTLYAVLLAFLVIAVWETYGAAKDNAAAEASTLSTLYRQTNAFPAAQQREMRARLREYTEAVVTDEWPIQAATGGASQKARKAIGDIYRAYQTMDPKVAGSTVGMEFFRRTGTVADDRDRRRGQAADELPAVLWAGLLIGAAIVVGMTFVLYMDATWPHVLFSVLMAVLMGTMLFIAMVLNRPFVGPLALQADSFEHSLTVFDSVDKGQ